MYNVLQIKLIGNQVVGQSGLIQIKMLRLHNSPLCSSPQTVKWSLWTACVLILLLPPTGPPFSVTVMTLVSPSACVTSACSSRRHIWRKMMKKRTDYNPPHPAMYRRTLRTLNSAHCSPAIWTMICTSTQCTVSTSPRWINTQWLDLITVVMRGPWCSPVAQCTAQRLCL